MKRSALVAVLIAAHLVVLGGAASAAPLGPKKPSDFVTLGGSSNTGPFAPPCTAPQFPVINRVNPDGSVTGPFSIPPGLVLVITGVSWIVTAPPALYERDVELVLYLGAQQTFVDHVFTDSGGNGGKVSPVANVVVKSGTDICAVTHNGIMVGGSIFVHGYLTQDR